MRHYQLTKKLIFFLFICSFFLSCFGLNIDTAKADAVSAATRSKETIDNAKEQAGRIGDLAVHTEYVECIDLAAKESACKQKGPFILDCSELDIAIDKCNTKLEADYAMFKDDTSWNQWKSEWKDQARKEKWKSIWSTTWKSALHMFLNNLSYQTATALASAAEGQGPMFYPREWLGFFQDLADDALGEFLDQLAGGFLGINICEPNIDLQLGLILGVEGGGNLKPNCSVTDIYNEMESYIDDPGSLLDNIKVNFLPGNNDISIGFDFYAKYFAKKQKIVRAAVKQRDEGKGLKPKESKVSGSILTPAKVTGDYSEKTIDQAIGADYVPTGDIFADALNTFTSTLASQLFQIMLEKGLSAMQGLTSGASGSSSSWRDDVSSGLSSVSDFLGDLDLQTGDSGETLFVGTHDYEKRFSTFLKAGITKGGPYRILQQLTTCIDEENPGPDECVIDQELHNAIYNKLTVKEAIKQGFLDGDIPFGFLAENAEPSYKEGYPYRSILILRTRRVLPVTWEIAAQAIKHEFATIGEGHIYTLNELITEYENPASIFYHLIDENWVLKAPEHYCKKMGYGSVMDSDSISDSMTDFTRDEYCADYTSCIDEKSDGECRFYGYCMEEKRIWDLHGVECPEEFSSCLTFIDPNNKIVSYLESTLEYNGCNADNTGCRWFCQSYNEVNDKWTCLPDDEKVIKSCNESNIDSDEVVGCNLFINCEMDIGDNICVDEISATILEIEEACNINSQWFVEEIVETFGTPDPADDVITSPAHCFVSAGCTIPTNGVECTTGGCEDLANFILNPSFEIGAPAGQLAEDWNGSWSYFERVSGDVERIYSGSNSLRFFSYGAPFVGDPFVTAASSEIILEAGSYTFSLYAYDDLNIGDIYIEVNGTNVNNIIAPGAKIIRQSSKKQAWQNLVTDFNVADGGTSDLVITIKIQGLDIGAGLAQASGSAWFDNFKISESCISNPVRLSLVGDIDRDQSKIHLDGDTQFCSAEADGCSEFIRLKENLGTNVVRKGSFEPITLNQQNTAVTEDLGWVSVGAGSDFEIDTQDSVDGIASLKLMSNSLITTSSTDSTFDFPGLVGMMAGKEYYLSFSAKAPFSTSPTVDIDSIATLEWENSNGTPDSHVFKFRDDSKITLTTKWRRLVSDRIMTEIDDSNFNLTFTNSLGQDIYIDAIQLEAVGINGSYSSYTEYGESSLVYIKKPPAYLSCTGDYFNDPDECNQYSLYCSAKEVGCEAYSPIFGGSAVTSVVAFTDYCPAECVGYEAYKQSPTFFESEEDLTYFIPSTANYCQASEVGCNAFTNLDEVAAGGESLEYYQYLRLCQKPDDVSGTGCQSYYTYHGSDETGYQLKVYNLAATSPIVDPPVANPPKESIIYDRTNIENMEERWPDYWCDDLEDNNNDGLPDCCDESIDVLTNPSCKEFFDSSENVYYTIFDNTVSCSEDCYPFRKTRMGESDELAQVNCANSNPDWPRYGDDGEVGSPFDGEPKLSNLDHKAWRNNACIYSAIPNQGIRCSSQAAGCREYKGNSSGNIFIPFKADFESGESSGWTWGQITAESLNVGGHSIKAEYDLLHLIPTGTHSATHSKRIATHHAYLGWLLDGKPCSETDYARCDDDVTGDCFDYDRGGCIAKSKTTTETCFVENGDGGCGNIDEMLTPDRTYLLSFWAKSETVEVIEDAFVMIWGSKSPLGGGVRKMRLGEFDIRPDWHYYTFGPFVYSTEEGDFYPSTRLIISTPSSLIYEANKDDPRWDFYVDNIEIKEVNDYVYAIRNSWRTPQSCDANIFVNPPELVPQFMLGCEQYVDSENRVHNLRSFTSLCRDKAVGCEALIDTYNYSSPFTFEFNPEDSNANVIVQDDKLVYMVNKSENRCSESAKGCQSLGLPEINSDEIGDDVVTSYKTLFLINDPDQYDSRILCNSEEVGCSEFQVEHGFSYFKDPGNKTCEYKSATQTRNFGWFRTGSMSKVPDCPVSRPELGPVHPGNADNNFVGFCPSEYSTCSQFVDPASSFSKNLVFNSNFLQDLDHDEEPDGWTVKPTEISQLLSLDPDTLYVLEVKAHVDDESSARVEIINCEGLNSFDGSLVLTDTDIPIAYDGEYDRAELILGPTKEITDKVIDNHSGRFQTKRGNSACKLTITYNTIDTNPVKSINVREAGVYYVLGDSVDKMSCNAEVNQEKYCILFNDRSEVNYKRGEKDTTYLVFDSDLSRAEVNGGVAVANCVGSCDSNVILKASPDRECAEWLDCSTMVTETDEDGQKKDICLGLLSCVSAAENGVCERVKLYETDEESMALYVSPTSPANIDKIKNYSGYVKVGAYWPRNHNLIRGYYPFNLMKEVGEAASVPNGNFESSYMTGSRPLAWDVEHYGNDPIRSEWTENKFKISRASEFRKEDSGHLVLFGNHRARSETTDMIGDGGVDDIETESSKYVLSAWINTEDLGPIEVKDTFAGSVLYPYAEILLKFRADVAELGPDVTGNQWFLMNNQGLGCSQVELGNLKGWVRCAGGPFTEDVQLRLKAGMPWQLKSVTLNVPKGIQGVELLLANTLAYPIGTDCSDENDDTICRISGSSRFDDISLKPVLAVNDSDVVNRSCKLYPAKDALSCKYYSGNNLFQGDYGYCMTLDSQNDNVCLQWLPIDRTRGETAEEITGYDGPVPLYYCMDSEIISDPISKMVFPDMVDVANIFDEGIKLSLSDKGEKVVTLALAMWIGEDPSHDEGNQYGVSWIDVNGRSYSGTTVSIDLEELGVLGGQGEIFFSLAIWEKDPWIADNAVGKVLGLLSDQDGGVGPILSIVAQFLPMLTGVSLPIPTVTQAPLDTMGAKSLNEMYTVYGLALTRGFGDITAPCNEIVQTVNSSGNNKGFATRVQSSSDFKLPDLRYIYQAQLSPFGSIQNPVGSPPSWYDITEEGAKKRWMVTAYDFKDRTHWAHRGIPYNIDISGLDSSLLGVNPAPAFVGQCSISKSICLDEGLSAYGVPLCPVAGELCITPASDIASTGSSENSKEVLKHLFTVNYGVWKWKNGRYVKKENLYQDWVIPNNECQKDSDYTFGIINRPPFGSGLLVNDYCFIYPVVLDAVFDTETIVNVGHTRLSFNAKVDPDQAPLTFYRVRWGDGTANSVSGVTLRSRVNPDNAFVFYHLYDYWQLLRERESLGVQSDDLLIRCGGDVDNDGMPDGDDDPATDPPIPIPINECWVRPEIWVQDNWHKSSEKVSTYAENGEPTPATVGPPPTLATPAVYKWLKVKNVLR